MIINPHVAIVEVRAGTGGEEAKIWADDLMRMYAHYAEGAHFLISPINENTVRISGEGIFNHLSRETGVHRVQRIPATEKRGRIHTSTAVVTVLPAVTSSDVAIKDEDLDWGFFRAGGHGGQNVNKVSTAVRLVHRPSGTVTVSQRERSQEQNKKVALDLLRSKLWQIEEDKRQGLISSHRQAAGIGERAEKIRTYNFPQNRVTDHRTGKSCHQLERVLRGEIDLI